MLVRPPTQRSHLEEAILPNPLFQLPGGAEFHRELNSHSHKARGCHEIGTPISDLSFKVKPCRPFRERSLPRRKNIYGRPVLRPRGLKEREGSMAGGQDLVTLRTDTVPVCCSHRSPNTSPHRKACLQNLGNC